MSEVPRGDGLDQVERIPAWPLVGIVDSVDLAIGIPHGGSTSFLHNLLSGLSLPSLVFGLELVGSHGALRSPSIGAAALRPVGRARYPSVVPLRLKSLIYYWRSRKRVLGSGVDLLYVHSPECVLPFLFGRHRLPVVFHQHGSCNPATYATHRWGRIAVVRWFFDAVLRLIYRHAAWIVAIDDLCASQALKHGARGRVTVLMNAVDPRRFHPDAASGHGKRRGLALSDDDPVFLVSARLEEVKRIDLAIQAVAQLRSEQPTCRLLIAGEGTQRESLERLTQELGVSDRVIFLGRIPYEEMPSYCNAANVLLLLSEREGTPMAVLEALSCGTPVVATPVGGVPRLIRDGENGFLVSHTDPGEIAALLSRSLSHAWDRRAIAASVREWTSSVVARHLERLFCKLARTRKDEHLDHAMARSPSVRLQRRSQ